MEGELGGFVFAHEGVKLEPTAPFCLEIFAGSGRLTACLREVGLDAWGVDHRGGKIAPETPALFFFDLTRTCDLQKVLRLLEHPLLVYVHLAPPCGTCSRARDIRPGPPPLRSEQWPLGLPGLEQKCFKDFRRVQSANKLYEATATIINVLITKRIAWSLENPANSLMWEVPVIKALLSLPGVQQAKFQNCMYGAERPKWTTVVHWPDTWLVHLSLV